jgi:hypothetical protein
MNAAQRLALDDAETIATGPFGGGELAVGAARRITLHETDADDRELGDFIRDCFARRHGAQITRLMPRLFGVRDPNGVLIAGFGLRSAAAGPLFLEQYLDAPVELTLGMTFGEHIRREQVLEVGHLSATDTAATRWLLVAMTLLLHGEGVPWIVFTGTRRVHNGLLRLGLRPQVLAPARRERLAEAERAHWGRYYEQSPQVLGGSVAGGYETLCARPGLAAAVDGRAFRGAA